MARDFYTPETAHEKPAVPVRWTDDCQGKKDFDGEIVCISTRYWSRGGGFTVLRGPGVDGPPKSLAQVFPEVRPSAHCSIGYRAPLEPDDEPDYEPDFVRLTDAEFEGETFQDVKVQVETWAAAQYERAIAALKREFASELS